MRHLTRSITRYGGWVAGGAACGRSCVGRRQGRRVLRGRPGPGLEPVDHPGAGGCRGIGCGIRCSRWPVGRS
jgi:hypothetical protein